MSEKNLTQQDKQMAGSRETTRTDERYVAPPVDIFETDDGLTLLADVPGLDEDTLQINVDKGVLTLEGKAPMESADRLYREFSMAGYWRQFQIPDSFDTGQAKAEMKNGVLTLHLPKAEAAKPKRIEISVD
ncbi:MAG TPA: Hsp20/alpha crystallin family protein [Desulfuromonadales bacterium]|nr:Hsp20/alpha crystallin family protein [Desulfuromonadales bacterium]